MLSGGIAVMDRKVWARVGKEDIPHGRSAAPRAHAHAAAAVAARQWPQHKQWSHEGAFGGQARDCARRRHRLCFVVLFVPKRSATAFNLGHWAWGTVRGTGHHLKL